MFVEGTSEGVYFDYFRGKNSKIKIRTHVLGKGDLEVIYRKCNNAIKQGAFNTKKGDLIAIVIDVDRHSPEDLLEFERKCAKQSIDLFISNPSFEVWLLMHYKDVACNIGQEELESELACVLERPYVKSEGIDIDDSKISSAMNRSRQIIESRDDKTRKCALECPSTTLHFLIEMILKSKE